MDKKEALQTIIYNLKEIEGTRIRLSSSKAETLEIDIALLNQQIINLYGHLQNYQSGMYASAPVSAPARKEEPAQPKIAVETIKPVEITDYIKEPVQPVDSELKRANPDSASRKERLKRLEAEAAELEKESKRTNPSPAPKGDVEEFTKIVDQKVAEEEIAEEAARISGNQVSNISGTRKGSSAERTLNEKLQDSTKTPESLNEKFAQNESRKTLADKMKLSPITDLKSAMALNQKIAFTNGLFGGDDKEFKKALAFLNSCTNFSEAKFYIQSEISKRHGWDDNNPMVEEFTELVYRKFL